MKRNLSKSKFLSGLQCEKRLWLESNDPEKAAPISDAAERILEQGIEAQVIWEQMINTEDDAEKGKMVEDLRAYCTMDTLAMVEIHKHLLEKLM